MSDPDNDPGTAAMQYLGVMVAYDRANQRQYLEAETTAFGALLNGGSAVYMQDFVTGQRSWFTPPSSDPFDNSIEGLAVDTAGGYFYTGNTATGTGQAVHMFTWDGLALANAAPSVPTNAAGWFDQGMSITAFTHSNGTHYVYAEDDGSGRNMRYAFTNVATTQRYGSDPSTGNTQGSFAWTTAPTQTTGLVGWWKFDDGAGVWPNGNYYVTDSSGNDHWGDMPPTSGTWNVGGGVDQGALALTGSSTSTQTAGIVFGKNYSVPAPDGLIENGSYPAMSFAIWVKTTTSGVVLSYQDAGRSAVPTNYVPMLYVGQDGKARAGVLSGKSVNQIVSPKAVNDGTWHHLALTVGGTAQTFYVDGAVAGTSSGAMTSDDTLTYTIMGSGFTTAESTSKVVATWASTPGGYFPYTGLLDDARLYNRALTATEVTALATAPAPSGPVAEWSFDEASGTRETDSTGNQNNGSVAAGTWLPTGGRIGGALSFNANGSTTTVTLPNNLFDPIPITFACWVKTSAGGTLAGFQGETYPNVGGEGGPMLYIDPTGKVVTYAGVNTLTSTTAVNDNKWHHLAVTVTSFPNATNTAPLFSSTLYIDGVAAASTATPNGAGIYSGEYFYNQFGNGLSRPNGAWAPYTGLLDQAVIYDRALSAAEVLTLANP